MCVQWHADDADVTDDRSFFLFLFVILSSLFSFPFVISTRRAKILIRGHLHHPCHRRAIRREALYIRFTAAGFFGVLSVIVAGEFLQYGALS